MEPQSVTKPNMPILPDQDEIQEDLRGLANIYKKDGLSIDTSGHPSSHRRVALSPVIVQSAYTTTTKGSPQQKSPSKASPSKSSPVYQYSPKESPVRKSPVKELAEESSPDTSGLMSAMILRKPNSLAYFIDIMSPTKASQIKVQIEQDGEPTTPRSPTKQASKPISQTSYFQFPKIRPHLIRPPSPELESKFELKLDHAAKLRAQHLHLRRLKLQRHFQSLKLKLLLHDSRQRLDKLRIQAKSELNHSVAQLNRELNLRKKREEISRHTEHVRRVMILTKMKKMMHLRRALSESFCDLLKKDMQEIQDQEFSGGFTSGLRVTIPEEEEYETQELTVDIPKDQSPQTAYNSSPSEARVGMYATDLESYLFNQAHSPVDSILVQIRRTKSLPQLVLTDSSDTVFLELLNLLPPITRFSLRELDMDEVLSNAQLRHDILFDPDLQFKTSTEDADSSSPTDQDWGPGDEKTRAYWQEMHIEVTQGLLYRIPLLVSEIRAILIELLPNGQDIKDDIGAHLDAHLIHQQIEHGIMDPMPIFQYIADLMKTNCAPIRDVYVDDMLSECKKGNIVKALKLCFDVFELMKLDYANHQLSRLRPYIIEHAVSFELKYFKQQVENGTLLLENTFKWLKECWEIHSNNDASPDPTFDLYPEAMINIMGKAPRYNDEDIVPETLHMDLQRLVEYFNSWQDITILGTILVVFKQASGPKCQNSDLEEAKKSLWVLLNDSESTMAHVAVQMAHQAGKIRGRTMSSEEITGLQSMTEKTLAPGSKLYELIQSRIGSQIQRALLTTPQPIDKTQLEKWGLSSLHQDITDLMEKVKVLGHFNRAVYGGLYANILQDIRQGLKSPLKSLFE